MSYIFWNDNAYGGSGEEINFVIDDNDKTLIYSQQQQQQQIVELEKECESPCSDSSKMCIAMCD